MISLIFIEYGSLKISYIKNKTKTALQIIYKLSFQYVTLILNSSLSDNLRDRLSANIVGHFGGEILRHLQTLDKKVIKALHCESDRLYLANRI